MDQNGETVVLVGARRQTLTVIRSLGVAGHRVLLVNRPGSAWVAQSRHLSGTIDGADLVAAVGAVPVPVSGRLWLYPIGDAEIAETMAVEVDLPDHVEVLLPPRDAVAVCRSKSRLYGIAHDLGVPLARTELVADHARLLDVADDVGYPCVLKGDDESIRVSGDKAVVLDRRPPAPPAVTGSGPVVVQRFARGRRHDVYVFAVRGQILSHSTVRTDRSDVASDTGLGVRGVGVTAPPGMVDDTAALIRAIDYDGPACVQFLHDPATGERSLLEINPRLDANVRSVHDADFDLPRWFLDHRRGLDVPAAGNCDHPGRRFSWTAGDVSGLLRALRRRELAPAAALRWAGGIATGVVATDLHLSWDRDDPAPTWRLLRDRLDPRRPRPTM